MDSHKLLDRLYCMYFDNEFELDKFPVDTITGEYGKIKISHWIESKFLKKNIVTRIKIKSKIFSPKTDIFSLPGEFGDELDNLLSIAFYRPKTFDKSINRYVDNKIYLNSKIARYHENNYPCVVFRNSLRDIDSAELYFNVTIGISNMMFVAYRNMALYQSERFEKEINVDNDLLLDTENKIRILHGYND